MTSLADMRILVAEDDFLICAHLDDLLTGWGCKVTCVARVDELRLQKASDFDIGLFDLTLTDGDVIDAAADLAAAGLPIIFQSGSDADELANAPGAIAVLGKPLNEATLLAVLTKHQASGRPRLG